MTVFLSDCAFCKNFRGFEKRPFGGFKKTFCLAYPEGIPISIENEDKVEGQICNKNNGIGYEEKTEYVREK